jgi:hypothetical protein
MNDKHVEVIVRQMMSRDQTRSKYQGDTRCLEGESVNKFELLAMNR